MKRTAVQGIPKKAAATACMLLLFLALNVQVVRAPSSVEGPITANIAVVIEITATKWPKWANVGKGVTNALADVDNGNPFDVTVKDVTTVRTNIQFKGSDNLELQSGADYIGIENVKYSKDTENVQAAVALTTSYVNVWTNIPVPSADITLHSYWYISTRIDQTAGTYTGTLYVKAEQA